jgi:hypothetical protein
LYASFRESANADIARGDTAATCNPEVVRLEPGAGRDGGALLFSAADYGWAEDEFTFAASGNFPYQTGKFDGSISMWLKCDPDLDLNDDVPVDPFHISRHAADGSFYLDLTRPLDWRYGAPRKLRFGIYGDSPEQDMFVGGQLLVVGDLNWSATEWSHVVATFAGVNSGADNAVAEIYIDGQRRGWMRGYQHRLTWDIDEMTIGLGQRFAGAIDELLILDKPLGEEQVSELYRCDGLRERVYGN